MFILYDFLDLQNHNVMWTYYDFKKFFWGGPLFLESKVDFAPSLQLHHTIYIG